VKLVNPDRRTLFLRIGNNYRLDLRGPGLVRQSPADQPFTSPFPSKVTIAPHSDVSFTLERLIEPTPEGPRALSPTLPGDYSLTVTLRVLARQEGSSRKQPMTIKAGPIPLGVELAQ
jgi:hypothetical protein